MPRTYRPENTGADFGEDLEDIGGVWHGHKLDPKDNLKSAEVFMDGGYSGSHIILALLSLIASIVAFAHRSEHLRTWLEKSTRCGGDEMEDYLGYKEDGGERYFVVLALVFATTTFVVLLGRVSYLYPYQKISPFGGHMFTLYRLLRVCEGAFEMAMVAFTVLALHADFQQDADSTTGSGHAYAAAGCTGSLKTAIAAGGYEEGTRWAAALVGLYLLIVRVIGIEEKSLMFNLDKFVLCEMLGVGDFTNRGRKSAYIMRKMSLNMRLKLRGAARRARATIASDDIEEARRRDRGQSNMKQYRDGRKQRFQDRNDAREFTDALDGA